MICPRCASNQTDNVKFCTFCGANLEAVREALALKDSDKKSDWWTEMFGEKAEERKLEMERRQGITAEVKRYNEIKGGVITSSVGIGLATFLHIFMEGVAAGLPQGEAEIVIRLWVVGAIPFFVGLALILNGLFVSRKQAAVIERERKRVNSLENAAAEINGTPSPRTLRPAQTNEFIPTPFSVTDQTTRHLVHNEPPTAADTVEK